MSTQTLNSIDSKELYNQYDWYEKSFLPYVQKACDEFFLPNFKFEMMSISKNINPLMGKDFYFVTKIMIDKQYDIFFRSSEGAISLILERILGKSNKSFNLNKITDLESKIITAFNDYMFNTTSQLLSPPPAGELRRTNFDIVHLTYLIKEIKNENNEEHKETKCGKFIISLPDALLNPKTILSTGEKFENTTFASSTLPVNIKVGTTKFSVHDLKNLDIEDLVVFDNSDIRKMTLCVDDYSQEINLNPNFGLITPIEDNGGDIMGAKNLWDSIEVEMNAEFDAVKITLGDLKNIEEGNVVDLTSLYENRVTLRVEDKDIARGELVIVNDRYGVKVTEVIAPKPDPVSEMANAEYENEEYSGDDMPQEAGENAGGEEEFDYSDFELDDEDI